MIELSKNAILYMPEDTETPIGVVQVIHDLGEYQGRYREIAQFLCHHGLAVITSDLRGHGNNLTRMNELGFFGDNAVSSLIGDIHENTRYIREQFPKIPYMLLGHGLGASIATIYFKRYDNFVDGLFLTGLPADRKIRIPGKLLIQLYISLRGEYFRSKFIDSIMIGPYYRPFAKEGSISAWLSSDAEVVHNYDTDPKCGFIYTLNGFRTITEILDGAYSSGSWIRKNANCPIRIFVGREDPCILNQTAFQKSVQLYTDNGYPNVSYIQYPGSRHDVFQDVDKEAVYDNILREMEKICFREEEEQAAAMIARKNAPLHIVLDDFVDPEVDKPFQDPEQKINLDEFIHAHDEAHPAEASERKAGKVEMIDYSNIEAFIDTDNKTFSKPEFAEYQSPASFKRPNMKKAEKVLAEESFKIKTKLEELPDIYLKKSADGKKGAADMPSGDFSADDFLEEFINQ